ncbi:uncharacterized protein [Eleutherodactylus coqui]|uniref:uncharacterized protein n=1 Tax=Eleutherodactylus coqui TaxID=57060 RepID=UPI003462E562
MAAPVHSSERGKMGAQEDKERRDTDAAGEVKNPPSPPPCMRRSVLQAAAHKTPPERPPAPISGARKVKTPSKSASNLCSSAPAATKQSPAGGASTLNSPLKAKRGASTVRIGAVRERHGIALIQKEPQMKCWTAYMRLPARLRRSGLKLWDPEKVKTLTSASRLPVSGEVKQQIIHHQTNFNRESSRTRRQNTLPQAAVKQTESSRKRMGITSRRESNQSGQPRRLPADEAIGGHQLSHQMNQLLLDDNGCDESRTSDDGRLYKGPHQTAQPAAGPHDARNSDQTVQDDTCHLKPNAQDNQKSSHLTDSFKKSGQIEATGSSVIKEDIGILGPECSYREPGDVQEQLPGNEESFSQPFSCHGAEDHIQDPSSDNTQPSCPHVNVVEGLYKTPSESEPTTEAQGQENCQSSHNTLKDIGTYDAKSQPASGEKSEPNSAEDDFMSNKGNIIFKPNLPSDERNTTEAGNQEAAHQRVWSRTNDVIRQSQGVLVLTRSTAEDAVFIPKLQFEVTPDNSIDWTMIGPTPLDSNKRCPTKKNDLSILNAFTPRGPSISKSLLKKSFMLSGHDLLPDGPSKSAQRFPSAEDVTRSSRHPLDRIVDLSISFQGKFEKQEVPANIPKILLSEDDDDDDDDDDDN